MNNAICIERMLLVAHIIHLMCSVIDMESDAAKVIGEGCEEDDGR
jgi:hypothetical protein